MNVDEGAAARTHLSTADERLARIIETVGPLTVERDPRYFWVLVSSIVSQQVSVRAAATVMARIDALFPTDGLSPAGLLALGTDTLRAVGLSGVKTRYILDLASSVAEGDIDLNKLPTYPDDQIITELTTLRGIGLWTAQMFLIFSLGRPDVLPVGDLGLRIAVQRAYNLDALPTPQIVHQIATPWAPYRTWATWYLWRSISMPLQVFPDRA